jgi:hypothetical protein
MRRLIGFHVRCLRSAPHPSILERRRAGSRRNCAAESALLYNQ